MFYRQSPAWWRGKSISTNSECRDTPWELERSEFRWRSRILILDGVNRRAGIESALKLRPELGNESIPVLFFVDSDADRIEQMLSDIRRKGSKSARSQGILCDLRDETSRITRKLIAEVDIFTDMTETVRSTISNRSLKLFTFSAIYHASEILLSSKREMPYADRLALAIEFWTEVSKLIPDWRRAKSREVSPAALRKSFVHAHAIALAAIARVGKSLIKAYPRSWKRRLGPCTPSTGPGQMRRSGKVERWSPVDFPKPMSAWY